MYHGRIVDTVDKADVTPDEVLGMIILGKRPEEASAEGARRSSSCAASGSTSGALAPVRRRGPMERRRERRVELAVRACASAYRSTSGAR